MITLQKNLMPADSGAWQDQAKFDSPTDLIQYYENELTEAQRFSYGYRVKNEDGSIDNIPDFLYQHA